MRSTIKLDGKRRIRLMLFAAPVIVLLLASTLVFPPASHDAAPAGEAGESRPTQNPRSVPRMPGLAEVHAEPYLVSPNLSVAPIRPHKGSDLDAEIELALAASNAWGPQAEANFRVAMQRLSARGPQAATRVSQRIRDEDPLSGELVGLAFLAGELGTSETVPALQELLESTPPPKEPGHGYSPRDRHDQNLGMSLLALEKIARATAESREIDTFLLGLLEETQASPNTVAVAARILRQRGVDLNDVAMRIEANFGASRASLIRLETIELVPGQSRPEHLTREEPE